MWDLHISYMANVILISEKNDIYTVLYVSNDNLMSPKGRWLKMHTLI